MSGSATSSVFAKERIITLYNFLPETQARISSANNPYGFQAHDVHRYLYDLPDAEWDVSLHPYQPTQYQWPNTQSAAHQAFLRAGIESAQKARSQGAFSYYFYRRDPHDRKTCKCALCNVTTTLESPVTLNRIRAATGMKVDTTVAIFGACYKADCFLHTHTDTGRGKIAFVYNITAPGWSPEKDGGCFELLDHDWCTVKRTVEPTFNSLTIFDVEGAGQPHRVLPVVPTCTRKRFTVSGWFT